MPKKEQDARDVSFENIIVVPPDGGWGWVVVVAAFFCIFIMDGIANTYGLLLPIFQEEFQATLSQVSLVNSLFSGFYFLFGPVASALSNRFGFRAVIISGSLVSACGICVSVFNKSVELMFVTYGLVGGLGFSLMYINVLLTVGFYFERWRALATGITVSASGAGTFSFAPAVQLLLTKYTWRHIMAGYAGLVFFCSALAVCFRPLTPIQLKVTSEDRRSISSSKKHGSMHYPTAAEATNLNSLIGSKASIHTNAYSSLESLQFTRYYGRTSHSNITVHVGKRPGHGRTVNLEDIESVSENGDHRDRDKQKRRCPLLRKCIASCCNCKKQPGLRPMYRDDIFYEGSVSRLLHHDRNTQSNPESVATTATTGRLSRISNRSLFYNMSVSRVPTRQDVREEEDRKWHACPERLTRVLRAMFDYNVFKIPTFLLYLTSTSVLALGALIPIQFSYVRAVDLNIMSTDEASLMISTLGITNTIGRIICGILGSISRVNIILLHVVFLLFGALLNTGVIFFCDKIALYIYASLYGLVLAEQGSMRSVILVQLVGLENLTNAFGILLLFLGLFTIVGTPLAGYLKEATYSYDSLFYYSSAVLTLSAATSAPLLFWKKFKEGRSRPVIEAGEE